MVASDHVISWTQDIGHSVLSRWSLEGTTPSVSLVGGRLDDRLDPTVEGVHSLCGIFAGAFAWDRADGTPRKLFPADGRLDGGRNRWS
ncbi:hypothetical protein AB7C87_23720 [Natrarchaeobius sp. A-rgal3]|uniref:hypothetical protein n=1 Tax=Natrarchaeobius versutus TaxID=1679078 RepID=UPI00351071E3